MFKLEKLGNLYDHLKIQIRDNLVWQLGKVPEKKIGKSLVFDQTPLGNLTPPPTTRPGFFRGKKLTPIFLLENEYLMAETNFTFAPILKTNKFLFKLVIIQPT